MLPKKSGKEYNWRIVFSQLGFDTMSQSKWREEVVFANVNVNLVIKSAHPNHVNITNEQNLYITFSI